VLIALENLLFLLFPVRLLASTPGDFQALGRNVLLALTKTTGLALAGMGALVSGIVAWLLTHSWAAAVAAAWLALAACGAVLVPCIALAFTHFDVGRDTPA
jgi:hypothetical protein